MTTVAELVKKIFINVLVKVNNQTNVYPSDSNGRASVAQSKHGKHFEREKPKITHSDDVTAADFTSSNELLGVRPLKNCIPK